MPPKKNSRSALWYYAKECIDNHTINVANIREAIEAVYPAFKAMPGHDKAKYERMYEDWKSSLKTDKLKLEIKHEPAGMGYDDDEKSTIEKLESLLFSNNKNQANKIDFLKNQKWYFIKFQSFCRIRKPNKDELAKYYDTYFVLAEVAIIEYSLINGISKQYQEFIKPNKIPMGYRGACNEGSSANKIPVTDFDKISKDYKQIYDEIEDFIKLKQENNFFNSLFCLSKDLEETRFGLEFLADNADIKVNIDLSNRVLDIESLVLFLIQHSPNSNKISFTPTSAYDLLTSFTYDYAPNSCCSYHEEKETINCSLHTVKKFCYQISDYICSTYDIRDLTSNHLPVHEEVATIIPHQNFASKSKNFKIRRENGANKRNYEDNKYEEDERNFKNGPFTSTDIRLESQPKPGRRLVSDKFENSSIFSTSSVSNGRFESKSSGRVSFNNKPNNIISNSSVVSSFTESNQSIVSSFTRPYQTDSTIDEEDQNIEDDSWTVFEERKIRREKQRRIDEDDIQSETSQDSSRRNASSITYKSMGRGSKPIWAKKN